MGITHLLHGTGRQQWAGAEQRENSLAGVSFCCPHIPAACPASVGVAMPQSLTELWVI